ncbi:hypothetical protein [Archangium primigenium]|uniref:hypothetical protein n=1 Tax=[Archangium] primigenium TaxID=2792470 RepID=UPI00195671B1|nr:hypothetical protein [Archangium primigenium]
MPVSLAPWEPSADLPSAVLEEEALARLVTEAREASGEARQALLLPLVSRLESLGAGGGSRENADVLLRLLEGDLLRNLEARGGRPLRSLAVEALLRMGYPYALEVRPEDLAFLRDEQAPTFNVPLIARSGAVGALALGFFFQWGAVPTIHSHSFDAGIDPPLALAMGLSALSLVAGLLGPPRSLTRQVGLGLLVVLGVLQLWMGSRSGYHGQVSGAAGLLAWLLLVLARR